jgi:hypothetical protein
MVEMNQHVRREILANQKDEITSFHIYQALAFK